MEKSLTVTEASRRFADLVNRAYYRGESTLLLKSGEPVARLIPVKPDTVLGSQLAEKWPSYPHLSGDEAEAFARDIDEAQECFEPPQDPWES